MRIERKVLDEVIERFREQGGVVLTPVTSVHCPLNSGCTKVNKPSCRIEHCLQQDIFKAHLTENSQPPEIYT
jgi:hypothetical protein